MRALILPGLVRERRHGGTSGGRRDGAWRLPWWRVQAEAAQAEAHSVDVFAASLTRTRASSWCPAHSVSLAS
jgi:hypothetical protein